MNERGVKGTHFGNHDSIQPVPRIREVEETQGDKFQGHLHHKRCRENALRDSLPLWRRLCQKGTTY